MFLLLLNQVHPNKEVDVWYTHFDEMVSAVQDPDRLAEDAVNAGLISKPVKDLLLSAVLPASDKALTVLLTIEREIKEGPQLLHTLVIPVLRTQPGLSRVVSTLQASYGELLHVVVQSRP